VVGPSDVTLAAPEIRDATTLHHGRHEHLISVAPRPNQTLQDPDAIIVPTGRRAPSMEHAIKLAAKLHCKLVALCSRSSIATEVVDVAKRYQADVIVIDVMTWSNGVLPRFATSKLLNRTEFWRTADTSHKRNLGLLLARLSGWQRVVFLDDDITIPDHEDLRMAAWLTDDYAGVGIEIDPRRPSFPDNSVVCHAYRDAGGDQGTFIGGGALAIGAESMNSFFPNIYNEDWFFLLGEETLRPVTMTGRAQQRPYDPYIRRRAESEELGDCLAEGLFWLLDAGRTIKEADERYWKESLTRRLAFIDEVSRMVNRMTGDDRKKLKMQASLLVAKRRCERITPKLCADYVKAWQRDRERWRWHVDNCQESLGALTDVEKVLSSLGLAERSYLT
jgi:glycosyltransferase involved in cell wall biosynthesis